MGDVILDVFLKSTDSVAGFVYEIVIPEHSIELLVRKDITVPETYLRNFLKGNNIILKIRLESTLTGAGLDYDIFIPEQHIEELIKKNINVYNIPNENKKEGGNKDE